MQQLKQVVHNHYPVAAIIGLRLKGFVGLCRCSLVASVLSIILPVSLGLGSLMAAFLTA